MINDQLIRFFLSWLLLWALDLCGFSVQIVVRTQGGLN
jgi:hypothetical protein